VRELMRHAITVLVDNQPGVLSRVAGLFSGRGFNIESLSVAPTLDPTKSKMVIITSGNEQVLEQIKKQLNKIINVIKVVDFVGKDFVEREMILIKVKAKTETRAEVLRIADIFRAKVVDVSQESYTLSLIGDQEKLKAFIDLLAPMGIIDFIRTGTIVMEREMQGRRKPLE
jgi:acetolactate synthase-1/3 small subunit